MPTWLTIFLALGGSAIISTVIGLIITRIFNKTFQKYDQKAEAEKQRDLELEHLKAEKTREERKKDIIECVGEIINPLVEKVDLIDKKLDKVEDGTLSTLRNDILTCYYKCVEKGYRNDYDYQNIHHMYDSYSELHGNSYVADVIKRFDDLPVKEETVAVKVVERKLKEKVTA